MLCLASPVYIYMHLVLRSKHRQRSTLIKFGETHGKIIAGVYVEFYSFVFFFNLWSTFRLPSPGKNHVLSSIAFSRTFDLANIFRRAFSSLY